MTNDDRIYIFSEFARMPICPEGEQMKFGEMELFAKGFQRARDGMFDIIDEYYAKQKTNITD